MGAGFGLPPCVDNGAFLVADDRVIPHPRFGVDRLADRAEQAEAGEIMLVGQFATGFHERANGRGGGVEHARLMPLDHCPKPGEIREVGRAFVHERRGAVEQGTVDDIAVARDPADIGGAPVDVGVLKIKDVSRREIRTDHVSAGGVDDALGLTGRAAGVEDEEKVFRIHLLGGTVGGLVLDHIVPPHIAAGFHFHGRIRTVEHNDLFDELRFGKGFVDIFLQRNDGASAIPAVSRDDDFALGIFDAVCDCLAGEASEDDRMGGPHAGAGQHGDCGFGHLRHIDRDAVAFFHTQLFEAIGKTANIIAKLAEADSAHLAARPGRRFRFAFPQDGGLVAAALLDLPIEAIECDIGFGTGEPFGVGRFPIEHLVPRLEPTQFAGNSRPEFFRLIDGLAIERVVFRSRLDPRPGGKTFGRWKLTVFLHR